MARIAVAYEKRFSEYVRVATAIAGDPERGRDAVQDARAHALPRHPGTQDSRQGTLFRVPVDDQESAERARALPRSTEGVERAELS